MKGVPVRLSISGRNRVYSVSSVILAGSNSHLHNLSGNFKRHGVCKVCITITKVEVLANSLELKLTLTLSCLD